MSWFTIDDSVTADVESIYPTPTHSKSYFTQEPHCPFIDMSMAIKDINIIHMNFPSQRRISKNMLIIALLLLLFFLLFAIIVNLYYHHQSRKNTHQKQTMAK